MKLKREEKQRRKYILILIVKQADCCNALGVKYVALGGKRNIKEAIKYHQQELDLSYKLYSLYDVSIASRFKGDCYMKLRKFHDATDCYMLSINTIRERFKIHKEFKIDNDGIYNIIQISN